MAKSQFQRSIPLFATFSNVHELQERYLGRYHRAADTL